MLGNMWEWCSDWTGDYSGDVAVDPIGPAKGSPPVLRGGSWDYVARIVRSACRSACEPGYRDELSASVDTNSL
jgi:formylglycine-generating enzyme required for sulfatase activity